MSYDFVIFDCDGVVVDTETTLLAVFYRMVKERGLPESGPEAFLETFRGLKTASILESLEKKHEMTFPSSFLSEYREECQKVFHKGVEVIDGIEEVLKNLKKPFCMASNSPLDFIRDCLTLTNLLPYFDGKIFSAYDVGHWKPDPFLFQYAADQFGFQHDRCLVVEDSIPGVRAAVAASMSVLGYATGKQAIALKQEGATVISDMRSVLTYASA